MNRESEVRGSNKILLGDVTFVWTAWPELLHEVEQPGVVLDSWCNLTFMLLRCKYSTLTVTLQHLLTQIFQVCQ